MKQNWTVFTHSSKKVEVKDVVMSVTSSGALQGRTETVGRAEGDLMCIFHPGAWELAIAGKVNATTQTT